MQSSRRKIVIDLLILVVLLAPAYFISVMVFLVGFLVIPNGVPYPSTVTQADYNTYFHLATNLQNAVFFVLPGAMLLGGVARVAGARLAIAILIEFALCGAYWIALLGIYIAGIRAGVFVSLMG